MKQPFCRMSLRQAERAFGAAAALWLALGGVHVPASAQEPGAVPAPSSQMLEPVVITATPFPRTELDALQPVSVLRGEALRLQESTNLGATLGREPGVHSSAYGPGAGRPVIRGMDSARVRIVESGLGVADVSGASPDHRVAADTLNSAQVEILRGPATLLYGSGAIGGLVNIVSERVPLRRADSFGADLNLRATTAERERTAAFAARGPAGGDLGWRLEGFSQRTDEYRLAAPLRDDAGDLIAANRLPNSQTDTQSIALGGAWFGAAATRIGLAVQRYQSDYGIPNPEEPVTIGLRRTRYELQGDAGADAGPFTAVRSRFGFTDYRHTEIEPDGAPGAVFTNKGIEGRIELPHRPLAGWGGLLGVQLQRMNTRGVGEGQLPTTRHHSSALFAVEERHFGDVRAELGVRLERERYAVRETYDDGELAPSRSFTLFTASAGAGWAVAPGWDLGATLTSAQRAPAVEELYFVGAHPATFAFEIGDPGLRKEKATNLDVSLQYAVGPVRARVSLFVNHVRDYIYGFFDGTSTDLLDEDGNVEETLSNRFFTQADARLTGGELDLRYGQRTGVQLRGWADRVRARLTAGVNGGSNLPRMSPSRIGFDFGWRTQTAATVLALTRVMKQNRTSGFDLRDGEPETATAGYTMIDFGLTWRTRWGVTLFAQGKNLTDADARIHTSFLKEFAPLPGRSFWLGLGGAL